MCGIAGIVGSVDRPVEDALVRAMTDALWHRGPDDEGFLIQRSVGLGMRRLAIIDVESGRQPIHNEEKSVWVVFNGEIYNHEELRADLQAMGHTFYTHSDTEVLVHLYEEYGDAGVERLRGMFAYALWDEKRSRLLLVRDRLGIKPLYYARFQGKLLFASELKAFYRVPGFPRELNPNGVERFLTYLYVPGPETIWQDIAEVPPAHYLVYEQDRVTEHRYWSIEYAGDEDVSAEEWQEQFLSQFAASVKSHLMSEVPLGAFLSGGIDSSAMVGIMAQQTGARVKTFSIGYEGKGSFQDERRYARIVADRFGTEHHEFIVSPDIRAVFPEVVAALEQPFADSSSIPNYYISKLTRQHVTVALSGLGGDEIGGGYQRYLGMLWAERYRRLPPLFRSTAWERIVARLPDGESGRRWIDRAKRFVAARGMTSGDCYAAMVTTFSAAERERLLTREFRERADAKAPERLVADMFATGEVDGAVHAAMLADLKLYLPGDLLTLADRISMQHSLEVRVPFLDHPLVELMARVPRRLKLSGWTKKVLMRKAFAGLLPASILNRRKLGFSVPLALWLRTDLKDTMREILGEAEIRRLGYLQHSEVERIMHEHLSGRVNHENRLWALMNLVSWHRRWGTRGRV